MLLTWILAQLLQFIAAIPTFATWLGASFVQWLTAILASGNPGPPVQAPPGGGISPGATPELDSLVLFGTGLLGAGGYALTRLRARRRA